MIEKSDALLVVDVQNDFCPGGALAVRNGDSVISVINHIQKYFDTVIATQDWHPDSHISFAVNHAGKKVHDIIDINGISQVLWPVHCVAGSHGAEFHSQLNTNHFKIILHKGMNPKMDSYSVFLENDKKTSTGMAGYLSSIGIKRIFLSGLATDYCVFYSAVDALTYGLEATVMIDACCGVDVPEGNVEKALQAMKSIGVYIAYASKLFK